MISWRRHRNVYFFGYGADGEPDMIRAITGRTPKVIGPALLRGYELRVQDLSEVTAKGTNPQKTLRDSWGDNFVSYVIVPREGSVVSGTLFRMRLSDRHAVDRWELVHMGWYDRAFVDVECMNGKKIHAETQVLAKGQRAAKGVDGLEYSSWVMPKRALLAMAESDRASVT